MVLCFFSLFFFQCFCNTGRFAVKKITILADFDWFKCIRQYLEFKISYLLMLRNTFWAISSDAILSNNKCITFKTAEIQYNFSISVKIGSVDFFRFMDFLFSILILFKKGTKRSVQICYFDKWLWKLRGTFKRWFRNLKVLLCSWGESTFY